MKKMILTSMAALLFAVTVNAQTALKKVYNEDINPLEQIDQAVTKAKGEEKLVICQVGGNWCPWCLRFEQGKALMARLNNCGRFGFPVFVVLDKNGKVLHIQDSSFLEEGQGYSKEKVLRFFKSWTPKAL